LGLSPWQTHRVAGHQLLAEPARWCSDASLRIREQHIPLVLREESDGALDKRAREPNIVLHNGDEGSPRHGQTRIDGVALPKALSPHLWLALQHGRQGNTLAERVLGGVAVPLTRPQVVDAYQLIVAGCLPRQRFEQHVIAARPGPIESAAWG